MMIDITNGLDMTLPIKEHVQFGTFDSREYGMRLIDRSAPTPSEKEIIETVPFMQGNYDFSMILGERMFGNRPVSYTFHLREEDYGWRKLNQTTLENKLMREGRTKLRDTYSPGYYYLGKCVSVNTEDDHVFNRLIIRMEFDCYPFKIAELPEGNDIWDEFNFELDVAQPIEFDVSGEKAITLINPGTVSVAPTIETTGAVVIEKGSTSHTAKPGRSKSDMFRLMPGENKLLLKADNTHIKFIYHKELI